VGVTFSQAKDPMDAED
jgi:hypothetical protein